jgi:hypothetical protein
MAKSRAGKQKRFLTLIKKYKIVSVFIVAVLLLLVCVIYSQIQAINEKARFEQARASLDKVYADIVKEAGKPDAEKKTQRCTYGSRKYGKGPLGCSVSVNFVYGVKNVIEAKKLTDRIDISIGKNKSILTKTYTSKDLNPFSTEYEWKIVQEIGSDYTDIKSGLSCTLSYIYAPNSTSFHTIISVKAAKNMSVVLVCGGSAKVEHYPVKSN